MNPTVDYQIGDPCTRSFTADGDGVVRSLTTIHATAATPYGGRWVHMPHIHAYRWNCDDVWQVADLAASRYYGPFDQTEAEAKMSELLDAAAQS